ncbi:MAG TPA: proton-conducting transporter membrane subunit [Candidatus Krumholzibacteria bacterium]|nr:proton-conducting transporter membrane subunit [Candidatus Krumholzibacteria bacterium]HPD72229.1 proton-conducting transporter membrane subunit [Candidatus Krumholzibacteria bacterium]HRY40839.1 proton-conducting transporter membrane subunit [Candidatus Krumholzibacteria bacterium]
MIVALVLLPLTAGALAFFLRSDGLRRGLLVATALAHSGLTVAAWLRRPLAELGGWLELDDLELLILAVTSLLFLVAAVYAVGYLRREGRDQREDYTEGFLFVNAPEATFTGCLLLFLGAMTLVIGAQHFGLMWVAVEGTTLASAPLIHFHRHHRSLEAAWKYLVICSVGIAIALLGNFFLVVATSALDDQLGGLTVRALAEHAGQLDPTWLRAAFLLLLVGYGTKMGLAPLHTWLPDAHSEAPSVVSALLSGALLNCAFLAILRLHGVCVAAGQAAFSANLLVGFGLVSMGFAAVFIVGQRDYKRMLAYSSVEHMGIAALGVGLGGAAGFGALLHVVNHSLTKGMLFLIAGNVLAAYRTRSSAEVTGLLRALPASGLLWLAGFLAVTGSPPFGPFLSEFTILRGGLAAQRPVIAVVYLVLLLLVFVGMAMIVPGMAHGETNVARRREPWLAVVPPACLGIGVLILGVYVPRPLADAITRALGALGLS